MCKKFLIFQLILLATVRLAFSQKTDFDKVYDACCMATKSLEGGGSATEMTVASDLLNDANWEPIQLNNGITNDEILLNGHFVFLPQFIDSLIVNKKIYDLADVYYKKVSKHKGDGSVRLATKALKKDGVVQYCVRTLGNELCKIGVVAEAFGRLNVTVTLYDENGDEIDTIKNNESEWSGEKFRKLEFTTPQNADELCISITNKSESDISYALIIN